MQNLSNLRDRMVIEGAIGWRDTLARLFEHRLLDLIVKARWAGCSDRITTQGMEFAVKEWPTIEIVIWTPDMADAAIRGAREAFSETEFFGDYLPPRPQLWLNADKNGQGIVGYSPPSKEGVEYIGFPPNALVLGTLMVPSLWKNVEDPEGSGRPGVLPCYILQDLDNRPSLPIFRFLPPLIQGQTISAYSNFVGALAWIAQPFVDLEEQTIHRSIRRAREREQEKRKNLLPIPTIRSIILRKKESKRLNGDTNGQNPVDWNCSWIVDGHWRKQWYPSLKLNKPKYVKPYVKGDLTKPLKLRNEAVYLVKR